VRAEHRKQRNYRLGAAMTGAGVLVAMGVITVGASAEPFTLTEPATTTKSTAPTTLETTKATPAVTASTSQGEWPEISHVSLP
jgi:hypothetical protein